MTGAEVTISGVEVQFDAPRGSAKGRVLALPATDLVLERGRFTALVGPSGCGKSTLMNVVAGFQPVSAGEVRLDGRPIGPQSERIGVVFQQYALFPWMTALGNVRFALRSLRLGLAEEKARAIQALAEVGLADHMRKFPGQLSGGMRQRVALARSFVRRPALLLMDEPFGALDAQTRLSMHQLLSRIFLKSGTTILFITHDIDEALMLADRVLVMSPGPGRILRDCVLDHPRPRSPAQFPPDITELKAEILDLLHPSFNQAPAAG
ncbi:ABC transporter ATP-binding protein [uncultured Paracoccus sp.]|uniref:ABC transporter ATP-binding protein n=1 Tax=uncultured Paracoccus sp. TaxID=189685 RepID=UPI0025E8D6C2|nr:ABC transporter ATP-binding protein [uncultured Paracoccus sp.]